MSLVEIVGVGWLIFSAGTFTFLSVLALHAMWSGGIQPYRRLQITFPSLMVILLAAALVWPWALFTVHRLARKNT